jgi:ubiquinol-cytochrome c reductase cytochrome b subunit
MMYVLVLCVAVAAVLAVMKGGLNGLLKGVVAVGAVVLCLVMLNIDAKFWGVVVMGGAVVILFFLPWLDNSAVKSIRYRPSWHLYVYAVFVVNFVVLSYLGVQPPSAIGERISQVGTLYYFGFFLLMPWWSSMGDTKPVPSRVNFAPH